MSATTKIWANGLPPTCEDDDLNGFKAENNNLIIGSGQLLSTADNQQTHKAVAHYAGTGDFYVDSGTSSAYILSVTGAQVAPPTYATGMRFRFVPGNTSVANPTINVASLGVKNLVSDVDGSSFAGLLRSGSIAEGYYDGTDVRITSGTGGAPVLLETITASSDPTIDFTTNIDSAYDHYFVELLRVIPQTPADDFRGRFSVASTFVTGASYWNPGSLEAYFKFITDCTSSNTNPISGRFDLYMRDATLAPRPTAKSEFVHGGGGSAAAGITHINHSYNSGSDIDGIRFYFSTGNVVSGVFKLYGVPK